MSGQLQALAAARFSPMPFRKGQWMATPARAAHTGLGMRLWGLIWLPCGSIEIKAEGVPLAFAPPS